MQFGNQLCREVSSHLRREVEVVVAKQPERDGEEDG
jgi:hypothetical protein